MSKQVTFPWWLKPANRIVILLNRLGLIHGHHAYSLDPGRKTGKMRSTPVSVLKVNGQRYILTGLETGWVKNTLEPPAGACSLMDESRSGWH